MKTYDEEYDITKEMLKTINEGTLTPQSGGNDENGTITPEKDVIREFESSLQEKTGGSVSNVDMKIYTSQDSDGKRVGDNVVAMGVIKTPINIEFTMDLTAGNGLYVSLNNTQLTTDGVLFLQKLVGFYSAWENQWGEKLKEY